MGNTVFAKISSFMKNLGTRICDISANLSRSSCIFRLRTCVFRLMLRLFWGSALIYWFVYHKWYPGYSAFTEMDLTCLGLWGAWFWGLLEVNSYLDGPCKRVTEFTEQLWKFCKQRRCFFK